MSAVYADCRNCKGPWENHEGWTNAAGITHDPGMCSPQGPKYEPQIESKAVRDGFLKKLERNGWKVRW